MYADRHARSSGLDPRSLAIAVALNGAAVAGLLLASPVLQIVRHDRPLTTYPVPLTPPPEPPPPEPAAHPDAHREIVTVPLPRLDPQPTQPPVATTIDVPPLPPIPADAGTGPVAAAGPAEPVPLALVGPQIDPRFSGDLQPDYPPAELRAEREGVVVVRVLVGTDGRVREVEPVSATSDAFLAATRDRALKRWRFRPATRGSVPVEGWRQMTIRFVIPR